MVTYDKVNWPDGRVGLITSGEDSGMYVLVVPDSHGRWLIYAVDDFELTPADREVRQWDAGIFDDAALEKALLPMRIEWLDGEPESATEKRLFDLRRAWAGGRTPGMRGAWQRVRQHVAQLRGR